MHRHSSILLAILACAPLAASAALRASGRAEVSFTVLGSAGLRIVGTTHDLAVAEDGGKLRVEVPLGHLTTGIDLRDSHMKERLEASRYRTAEIVIERGALRFPTEGPVTASLRASMTLHGTTRPVTVRYTATRSGQAIRVQGSIRLDMRQFGIEPPSYLGISVRPSVDVTARFAVQDQR